MRQVLWVWWEHRNSRRDKRAFAKAYMCPCMHTFAVCLLSFSSCMQDRNDAATWEVGMLVLKELDHPPGPPVYRQCHSIDRNASRRTSRRAYLVVHISSYISRRTHLVVHISSYISRLTALRPTIAYISRLAYLVLHISSHCPSAHCRIHISSYLLSKTRYVR